MEVKYIVVHRTESAFGDAELINIWHVERGFDMIGYHYLIGNSFPKAQDWTQHMPQFENDGRIEVGRAVGSRGAHAKGYNSVSIGIALVGMRDFTSKQFASLAFIINKLKKAYPDAEVVGHCELDSKKKACPSIDMDYLRGLLG